MDLWAWWKAVNAGLLCSGCDGITCMTPEYIDVFVFPCMVYTLSLTDCRRQHLPIIFRHPVPHLSHSHPASAVPTSSLTRKAARSSIPFGYELAWSWAPEMDCFLEVLTGVIVKSLVCSCLHKIHFARL